MPVDIMEFDIMLRLISSVLVFVVLQAGVVSADNFVPDDVLISNPNEDFPDPEFDPKWNLLTWADFDGTVWVADVDPVTGDITPNNGKGSCVPSDCSFVFQRETINGPEWSYERGEPYILLTGQFFDKPRLWVARRDTAQNWVPEPLNHSVGRFNPNGASPSNQDEGRVIYGQRDQDAIAWRIGDTASTETALLGVKGAGGRSIEGKRSWMYGDLVDGIRQIFEVDIDTGQSRQITFGNREKTTWHAWWSPEYDAPLIVTRLDTDQLAIYREINGVWRSSYRFRSPSPNFRFFSSPEGFSWNGKSYVAFVAARALINNAAVPAAPEGPSQIWIAGVDPAAPFFRKISKSGTLANRSDPEVFTTENGPVVFYTEILTTGGTWRLRRAATGLGPRTTGMPDLAIQTIGSADSGVIGNPFTHTIRVQNHGDTQATGVEITNVIPSNAIFDSASPSCTPIGDTVSCVLGTLDSGAETQVDIALIPTDGETLLNTASVSAIESEPSLADNASTEDTVLVGGPLPATFTLNTVLFNGSGKVVSAPAGIDCPGTCTADFTNGQQVTLTATPDPGTAFSQWFGVCAPAGSDPVCIVDMTKDRWAYAGFR